MLLTEQHFNINYVYIYIIKTEVHFGIVWNMDSNINENGLKTWIAV